MEVDLRTESHEWREQPKAQRHGLAHKGATHILKLVEVNLRTESRERREQPEAQRRGLVHKDATHILKLVEVDLRTESREWRESIPRLSDNGSTHVIKRWRDCG